VYLVGARTITPLHRVIATWLWAGDDAVIGGQAAAWLHEISDEPPGEVDVIVAPGRRMSCQPGVSVIRGQVHIRDWAWRQGIRVTTVARTCLDLARCGRDDRLEEALRSRRLRTSQLPAALARGRYRRGQIRARNAVREVGRSPWSRPERVAHEALRAAGITGWVANVRAVDVPGVVLPDIAFPAIKLAVEIDGRAYHDPVRNGRAFDDEHARQLALTRAGWTVLRFTARQILQRPGEFAAIVLEMVNRLSAA
jgi:very-short-patch-repair endonuclease